MSKTSSRLEVLSKLIQCPFDRPSAQYILMYKCRSSKSQCFIVD